MKVLHIGKKGNMERFSAADSYLYQLERVDMYKASVEEILRTAGDADFIVADPVDDIPAELINGMPNLKLIHSEGVAFNLIDLEAASKRGIYVCNNKGMNASAVAEQTVLLMLGMLRNVLCGHQAVLDGRQISFKEGYMQRGDLKELADCAIGLIGFGDIARETARLLRAFGVCDIFYTKKTPLPEAEEAACGVRFLSMSDLLASSDIVSLHLPLSPETEKMTNRDFFNAMKDGSYFVNTSRGGLVDDSALIDALASGKLAMAGLDTFNDEPVQTDHPLLQLPPEIEDKLLFSPHIGGVTAASIRRGYAMVWEDVQAVAEGRRPKRIVNHL